MKLVGFPAFCCRLAFQHFLLYGILAVALAITIGFVIKFVFGFKGGH
ncbi:MAG: hypothetical protein DRP41_01105 [Thermodesulfobacteriota bacterium]|nr:MAG: hypothetical protein DRP41_01105 [Thermodesulfobacteriota bacterium]